MTTVVVHVAEKLFWSVRDLRALTGLSRSTIERMVARGELPPPAKMGKHCMWEAADMRARLTAIAAKARGEASS